MAGVQTFELDAKLLPVNVDHEILYVDGLSENEKL
jgi:hypothetical protein